MPFKATNVRITTCRGRSGGLVSRMRKARCAGDDAGPPVLTELAATVTRGAGESDRDMEVGIGARAGQFSLKD